MKSRTYLSQTELMVMLAIMRLGENAYGVPIAQEIGKCTGREIAIGVVYSALKHLEEDGFIRSSLGEATAARGGRAKTYFRVTAPGCKQVKETQQALLRMWNGIPRLKSGSA